MEEKNRAWMDCIFKQGRSPWEDDIWAELTAEAGAMQTSVGLMSQFSFFHSDLTGHCILSVFYSSWQLFFGPCCFLFLEYFLQSMPVVTPQPTFEMPLPPWRGRKRRKILTDPLHQAKYHLSCPSEFNVNGGIFSHSVRITCDRSSTDLRISM